MSQQATELSWQMFLKISQMQKDGARDKKIAELLEVSLYDVKRVRSQCKRQNVHWKKHGKFSGSSQGIDYKRKDVNIVRMHNNQETWEHYLTKCIITKLLVDRGHAVVTEAVAPLGVIDVYDIDTKYAYEAETSLSPKKMKDKRTQYLQEGVVNDVVIFDLKGFDISKPITEWIKEVEYRCQL